MRVAQSIACQLAVLTLLGASSQAFAQGGVGPELLRIGTPTLDPFTLGEPGDEPPLWGVRDMRSPKPGAAYWPGPPLDRPRELPDLFGPIDEARDKRFLDWRDHDAKLDPDWRPEQRIPSRPVTSTASFRTSMIESVGRHSLASEVLHSRVESRPGVGSAAGAAVPAPTTLALLGGAAAIATGRRRRRTPSGTTLRAVPRGEARERTTAG